MASEPKNEQGLRVAPLLDGSAACTELVLGILLDMPGLRVTKAQMKPFGESSPNPSICVDITAIDPTGQPILAQIHWANDSVSPKQARACSSLMDAGLPEDLASSGDLPDTFAIFMMEEDEMEGGEPLYQVGYSLPNGLSMDDGAHILYVNGAYRDKTPIGKLLHDFACTDPADMHYQLLAERMRHH